MDSKIKEDPHPSTGDRPIATDFIPELASLLAEHSLRDEKTLSAAFLHGNQTRNAHLSQLELETMAAHHSGGDMHLSQTEARALHATFDEFGDGCSLPSFLASVERIADQDAHTRSSARADQERTLALSRHEAPYSPLSRLHWRVGRPDPPPDP